MAEKLKYFCNGQYIESKTDVYYDVFNPSTGEINIYHPELKEDANIRVFSENFSLIYCDKAKKNKNNSVIYLDIPKGCYFIELQSKNKTFTEKLIIN